MSTNPKSRHFTAYFNPVALCVANRTKPEMPDPRTGPSCTPVYTSSIGLPNGTYNGGVNREGK